MHIHKDRTDEHWCPFSRPNADGTNREVPTGHPLIGTGCIGERCMAWRWKDARFEQGYCGLAGKPKVGA